MIRLHQGLVFMVLLGLTSIGCTPSEDVTPAEMQEAVKEGVREAVGPLHQEVKKTNAQLRVNGMATSRWHRRAQETDTEQHNAIQGQNESILAQLKELADKGAAPPTPAGTPHVGAAPPTTVPSAAIKDDLAGIRDELADIKRRLDDGSAGTYSASISPADIDRRLTVIKLKIKKDPSQLTEDDLRWLEKVWMDFRNEEAKKILLELEAAIAKPRRRSVRREVPPPSRPPLLSPPPHLSGWEAVVWHWTNDPRYKTHIGPPPWFPPHQAHLEKYRAYKFGYAYYQWIQGDQVWIWNPRTDPHPYTSISEISNRRIISHLNRNRSSDFAALSGWSDKWRR